MSEENVACMYTGILLSHRQKGNCGMWYVEMWMNLEDIRLSEIGHSQKDKCCMLPFKRGIK